MRRLLAAAAAALWLSSPAGAQERGPAQRQTMTELAYVLGASHGLRQVCEGPGDQYWRSWMGRLLEAEAPDETFDRRLRDSFNTGYASAQARFPTCSAASRAEAARAAQKGRSLARIASGG